MCKVLQKCARFGNDLNLKEEMKWMMFYATMPMGWHELLEINGP